MEPTLNSYDPEKIVVYCQGTFNVASPNSYEEQQMTDQAYQLGNAGFGTVILGMWHVADDGTISYGDVCYYASDSSSQTAADLSWVLTNVPVLLKEAGIVTKVLISFGGGNPNADLNGITANLDTFKTQLAQLLNDYPDLDGVDYDFETDLTDDNSSSLVDIVGVVSDLGKTVTAAPAGDGSWWLNVLSQTQTSSGGGFSWWNLQNPADYYVTWAHNISVNGYLYDTTSESFLVWQLTGTPANFDVISTLQAQKLENAGLAGSSVWDFEGLRDEMRVGQFALAMAVGLAFPAPAQTSS